MRQIGFFLVVIALAVSPPPTALAGLVFGVQAGVSGTGSALYGNPEMVAGGSFSPGVVIGQSDAGTAGGYGDRIVQLGAEAHASLLMGDTGIGLRATNSISNEVGRFGSSSSFAGAEWLDTIHVAGGESPAQLRLTVHVSGAFSFLGDMSHVGSSSGGNVGIANVTNVNSLLNGISYIPAGNYANYGISNVDFDATTMIDDNKNVFVKLNINPGVNVSNLRTAANGFFAANLEWDATFLVPLTNNGYIVNLYATAQSLQVGAGNTATLFGDTIKLTSVTREDGSSVDGISFDSGFRLVPVPEPSSLVLTSIAGLIGLCYAGRRKRVRRGEWDGGDCEPTRSSRTA